MKRSNAARSSKKFSARRFRFETLETRNLLAGNVTADVTTNPGSLTIVGDNSANVITLTQIAADTFKVIGAGTKVNGANAAQTFSGVTNGIFIDMSSGNDALTIKNITNLSGDVGEIGLGILLGDGSDALVMSNVNVDHKCGIDGGSGNNAIVIDKCSFNYDLGIQTYDGNDAVAITRTAITGGLSIQLGNGTNALSMVSDTVSQEVHGVPSILPPGFEVLTDDFFEIDCGAIITGGNGVDAIAMYGVQIDCFTQIDTLAGNDSVSIVNSQFGSTQDFTFTVQPAQAVSSHIDPSQNDIAIGLYLQTGLGSDAVVISNTKILGTLYVDTSNELFADGITGITSPYTIKDGNDSVSLLKVTALQDTPAPDNRSDSGQIQVYTGSQSDAVALNGVNTDGGCLIFATDLSFDSSTVDGADSVVVTNSNFDRQNQGVNFFIIPELSYAPAIGLVVETGNGNDVVTIANVHSIQAVVVEAGNGTDHVAISSLTIANLPLDDTLYCLLGSGNYDTLTIVNSSVPTANLDGGGNVGDTLVQSRNHFNAESPTGFQNVIG